MNVLSPVENPCEVFQVMASICPPVVNAIRDVYKRQIHDTLAHTGRKAGEESGSGGLYIYLGTFRVEAVLADGA